MKKKECVAMLLAGGQGTRLKALTNHNAKPAVSFFGKYRIIDFSLSNCVNSGIDTVGVLIQYRPMILNRYIGSGEAWDLDKSDGGVHILPPYATQKGGAWYEGTADAIYHNIDFVNSYSPEYIVILSGDHLYKMNYGKMLDFHKEKKADLTVSVMEVPMAEASRFGIMSIDKERRITEFAEKPANPKSNLASMGIYIFTWKALEKALLADHDDPKSEHDFGKNIIPGMLGSKAPVFAYPFRGYWKDIGTVDSYYEAHFDILKENPEFDLYNDNFKIRSGASSLYPAHIIGKKGSVSRSVVCNGAVVKGKIVNSVVGCGAIVEEGAEIVDSILLPDCVVGKNSKISHSIVNEGSKVPAKTVFGTPNEVMIYSEGGEK
ncbi:MAG TPA: glucose-1-phosphate adenylyltransferase [Spirochaetaceae bacterium]|nr:glucose-1-phosphate adenylyltransferase [Spirochaetaceae bacterium]